MAVKKRSRELFVVESRSIAEGSEWTTGDVDVYTDRQTADYKMADLMRDQEYRGMVRYRIARYVPDGNEDRY